MQFQLTQGTVVIRVDDGTQSNHPDSKDRQEYESWLAAGNTPLPAATPSLNTLKADAVEAIDNAVAAVYGRFTRFSQEYEEREAQAQAFKNAGYTGAVPQQVAAFATPAGKTPQEATDLILAQATQLRGALSQLGALRMRKYEVLRASTSETTGTALASILGSVKVIDSALS